MPQGAFLLWTTAGSLIWTLLLTLAGQALGKGYDQVGGWLAPWGRAIGIGLLVALAGFALLLVVQRLQRGDRPN
jgi:membrane protein DedA with SNARE-associated domain